MRALYASWLEGRTTAEAVRNASLQVLLARRKAGRTTHPFYWAGFVLQGEWR